MVPSQMDLKRLTRNRRIIYALVALVVLVPCLLVVPLPFQPSPLAAKVYDKIDGLKSGDHVLVALDYDPAAVAELNPMAIAIFRHCFKKGLVPVVMTHWPNGVDMAEKLIREAAEDAETRFGKDFQSGRDYVYLGYKPVMYSVIIGMGENLGGTFEKDYYGQPTAPMPALQGVNSLKDFNMAVDIAAGGTVGTWVAYGSDRYHFPLAVGTTAVQAPDMYPFLQAGQLVGMLGGLRGAADYEKLLDAPGTGISGMLAQSAAHVLLIVLILFTNVGLLIGLFAGKRKD